MSTTDFVQTILHAPVSEELWNVPNPPDTFADELEALLPRTFLVSRNLDEDSVLVFRLPQRSNGMHGAKV